MQHIVHGLLIADIPTAYAPHPLGVCLVQFAERVRVPLPASFYQPCCLHRVHDASVHRVLSIWKRLHGIPNFFQKKTITFAILYLKKQKSQQLPLFLFDFISFDDDGIWY
jgi:hypothetical protein